jgi:hypothetical protein
VVDGPGQTTRKMLPAKAKTEASSFVNGQQVIKDEPVPLNIPASPGAAQGFLGFRKLTLADNSVVFRCVDCPKEIGSRGELMVHRTRVHPAGGAGRKTVVATVAKKSVSPELLDMSLGELFELRQSAEAWAVAQEHLTADRDHWKNRAQAAEMELRRITAAMDRAGFVRKVEA